MVAVPELQRADSGQRRLRRRERQAHLQPLTTERTDVRHLRPRQFAVALASAVGAAVPLLIDTLALKACVRAEPGAMKVAPGFSFLPRPLPVTDHQGPHEERTSAPITVMIFNNLLVFIIAAILEISGCFAFWVWLRDGRTPLVALAGIASLIGFATALTRADAAFAGRAYAAYGGIYIAASPMWQWAIEGQQPSRGDLLGASIAVGGALVIVALAARG